jgi:hypothetical protein
MFNAGITMRLAPRRLDTRHVRMTKYCHHAALQLQQLLCNVLHAKEAGYGPTGFANTLQ